MPVIPALITTFIAIFLTLAGYWLGPNSSFGAAIALVLALLGTRALGTSWCSWPVYLAIALGQALVVALILTRMIPDSYVVGVIIPSHPDWHHALAHGSLQGIYLAAYVLGRMLRNRYLLLSSRLTTALRKLSMRQALAEEARSEYRKAYERGRKLLEPSFKYDNEYRGLQPSRPFAQRSNADTQNLIVVTWGDAFARKMVGYYVAILSLCAGGALLLLWIGREPGPRHLAFACMTGASVLCGLHAWLRWRSPRTAVYWPWALVALLGIGPAWSLGLHSAFSAVVVTLVFFGGAFRMARSYSFFDKRIWVITLVCTSYGVSFLLLLLDVVSDLGNVPVLGRGKGVAIGVHLLLQATFVAAFVAGVVLEKRYYRLACKLQRAAEDATLAASQIEETRAELLKMLPVEQGIFSGQVIGTYQVERLLGRGGMGEVYEAVPLDRTERESAPPRVALKLLRTEFVGDPRNLTLFQMEARAVAQIHSKHVVQVHSVGGLAGQRDGEIPYIAMEHISGPSLHDVLLHRGCLAIAEALVLVSELSQGLADIHEAGVLHRDIKPQNILRKDCPLSTWVWVDFGVAQLAARGTQPGVTGGTPEYMSPEQAADQRIDTRSDLYSLCLVIYRALVGRPAFTDGNRGMPPDPCALRDLPKDVCLALRIGLAERPQDRFVSARELGAACGAALMGNLSTEWRQRGMELLRVHPWRGLGSRRR